jgi:GT2 family glycosyltransferase
VIPPTASIVIPTEGRPDYLTVTLASVIPQAEQEGAEVLVVARPEDESSAEVARRFGARVVLAPGPATLNASRNAGARAAASELIVLIDDDVFAPLGWLRAMLDGAATASDHDVLGGPIRPRLEGGARRACGREPPPITSLDLGLEDGDASLVWGANMALRRRALERIGPFDESMRGRGDEEDWERRYTAAGGRIRYLAAAGLDHRRSPEDSTVRRLSRAAYGHGRAGRRYDRRKGQAPPLTAELRTLAGCVWHIFRRRCANGIVLTAQSAGRVRETLWG